MQLFMAQFRGGLGEGSEKCLQEARGEAERLFSSISAQNELIRRERADYRQYSQFVNCLAVQRLLRDERFRFQLKKRCAEYVEQKIAQHSTPADLLATLAPLPKPEYLKAFLQTAATAELLRVHKQITGARMKLGIAEDGQELDRNSRALELF